MADGRNDTVMHRKLSSSTEAGQSVHLDLLRALRQAVARVARQQVGLRLDVIGATIEKCPRDGLAEAFGDDAMLALLRRGDGLSGAMALGPELVRALVQQQTIGMLRDADTAGQGRVFTNTDCALSVPVVEAVLQQASDLSEMPEDANDLSGHTFDKRVKEGRAVAVALDGEAFRVIELTLDIDQGRSQCSLQLVLPDVSRPDGPGDAADRGHRRTLGDVALQAPVRLNAVMCRVSLAWADLASLSSGDLLPLPVHRLDRTELLTMSGLAVGWGRLGKVDGLRAVRVNETTSPDADFSETPAQPTTAKAPTLAMTEPPQPAAPNVDTELNLDNMDQDTALRRISELAGLEDDVLEGVVDTPA